MLQFQMEEVSLQLINDQIIAQVQTLIGQNGRLLTNKLIKHKGYNHHEKD